MLRARIAEIIARSPLGELPERPSFPEEPALGQAARPYGSSPRPDYSAESWIEHVFREEPHEIGAVYRARRPSPLGHRVGLASIASARQAEAALLALMALDPALAGCDLSRALYVDTETTGLSGGTGTVPFLVGLGFFDADHTELIVEQILLRNFAEEAAMIEHLRKRVEDASMLVTFNGKAFDWPLLCARATMNRAAALPERPHLDLLHVVRRLHKHRLASCSLKSVEDEVLGCRRVDDVSGGEIGPIYFHYLRTRDLCALEPVVRHNELDVVSMVALVGLYGEPLEAWATNLASSRAQLADASSRVGGLDPTDLAQASKVLRRGGDLERALAFAETSVELGAGSLGHRARGDVSKARGDKAAALADYERAVAAIASAEEADSAAARALRLELAKLYEHHARSYDLALAALAQGTTEHPEKHAHRLRRVAVKKRQSSLTPDKPPRRKRSSAIGALREAAFDDAGKVK